MIPDGAVNTTRLGDTESDTPETSLANIGSGFLKTMVAVSVFSLIFLLPGWAAMLLMMFLFPIFFLWTQVMIFEGGNIFTNIARTGDLMMTQFGQMLGLYLTQLLCGALFFLILDTGLLWFLLDILSMNFYLSAEGTQIFEAVAVTGISVFVLLLIFGLWAAGSGLQYFSILEADEAFFLKKRLELIGKRERIRGLEREG